MLFPYLFDSLISKLLLILSVPFWNRLSNRNGRLYHPSGEAVINDNGLAAITLLVAESDPVQKETIIRLIMNMLSQEKRA